MPFFTTALIAGGLAAAGSLGGAAIASSAAGNAAKTQSTAAMNAAQLQYLSGQNALDFQKQVWNQQQANIAPWQQSGSNAISTLDQLMGLNPPNTGGSTTAQGGPSIPGVPGSPGGSTQPPLQNIPGGGMYSRGIGMLNGGTSDGRTLAGQAQPQSMLRRPGGVQPGVANGNLVPFAPWNQKFTPPTADQARQTPGYQFTQDQGMHAVENSAAARGDLLSGNTLTDLTKFGQGLADTTYQQTYDRALGQYQQNYNIYENNQANQWNRLAALAGYGQTAVGQLGAAGQGASNNVSNILMGTSSNIGRDIQNAGAATASGYVGGANAWNGALGSIGQTAQMLPFLSLLNNNPGAMGTWPSGVSTAG
jgi:hypothetical protein